MKKNLGRADRLLRVLAAGALFACGALAPVPMAVRIAVFVGAGAYLVVTALTGTCAGYRLMGMSTCPGRSRR